MRTNWRLERTLANAWPALVDEPLGQWRLRAAGGFTGRANSALTTGDPGMPLDEALLKVRAFAKRHDITPALHVVVGSPLEKELDRHGWKIDLHHPGGVESAVLVKPVRTQGSPLATVHSAPPAGWWELAAGTTEPDLAQRHVLGTGDLVGYGVSEADGLVTGAVRAALADDIVHVARLAVRPSHRRTGLAVALMAAVERWGADHCARVCALQVALGNTAALALYERLGFTEHHRYRYWTPR